jgi:2-oxoglutarate-dependent dioxygenase
MQAAADPIARVQLTDGEIKFYQQEGWLFLPGVMTEQTAGLLRSEVMEIMRVIGLATTKLKQSNEFLGGSGLEKLVYSENLLSIASQLMGGPATPYLPFTAVKSPGGGRFYFHQDNQYTRFDGPGINLWMALNPMTPENGCLQLVPRSHLAGTLEGKDSSDGELQRMVLYDPEDFLPIRMRPGDLVAFTRLTVHGSGANDTSEPRVGYAMQYHRNDVKWLDPTTKEWKLLVEHPRWSWKAVKHITPPAGKVDGH